MGLNEFLPLLGEGLMIKQLPGLTAAVGIFVRAYGSWLNALLVRFPIGFILRMCYILPPLFPSPPPFGLLIGSSVLRGSLDCWTIKTLFFFCKLWIRKKKKKFGWQNRKMKERMIFTYMQWVVLFLLEHYKLKA